MRARTRTTRPSLPPTPPPAARRAPRATAAVRAGAALLALTAAVAHAEAGLLTARGRLAPELRLEAWGGSRTVGVGVVRPDAAGARAGLGAELLWAWPDRTLELRGARVWQLTPPRFATASATLGGAVHLVPEGGVDGGVGPHAGLTLALGGERLTVDLGLQAGGELFFRERLLRLPLRAALGVGLRLGPLAVGLHARAGLDLAPGQAFLGRGEVALSLGWLAPVAAATGR